MKISLLTILLLMTIISCGHNENWVEFKGKHLPDFQENYQILKFGDKSNIYLGGSQSITKEIKDNQYQIEDLCLIYESTDFGKTWNKLPLPKMNGEISLVDDYNENIVAVNQFIMNDSSQILLSEDRGKTWIKVFRYHKNNYIESIKIDKNNIIRFVAIEGSGIQKVITITKSKIDTIIIQKGMAHVQLRDNGFMVFAYSADSSELYEYDRLGTIKSRKKIDLNKHYKQSKQNEEGDILFYDSYLSTDILLFKGGRLQKINLKKFKNYTVIEPYIEDSLILIDGYFNGDAAFLGVIHTFLISEDFGQTWRKEEIPSSMITKPGGVKNKRFLTYAGMGRFQERKCTRSFAKISN